jgi:hypothetical protein
VDPKRLSPGRFLSLSVALALALISGVCLLPHDRHLRYVSLHDSAVVKAGWIYERIHDDQTPIDVMFIGTSHTVFGVDSAEVERTTRQLTGRDVHVVNFGLQHLGRNIHWLLAREALETRKVQLLVLEVDEDEPRDLHPAFSALADPMDIIAAPLLVNVSYLSDVSRLPVRQLSLFLRTILPGLFGTEPEFDPAWYRGAHWDDTWAEEGSSRAPLHTPPRDTFPSEAEMTRERAHATQLSSGNLRLPARFAWLERRANLHYVQQIAALAARHQVALRFLYLPTFHGAARPSEIDVYKKFAEVWYPPLELLSNRELWLDVNHLNHHGALALAAWLATRLRDEFEAPSSDTTLSAQCTFVGCAGIRAPHVKPPDGHGPQ